MRQNIVKYLRILFPFLITVALWRLSYPWINPAGILAIVPIFYCSFIRPVDYFTPFAILMCVMLDYKFDTVLFWTSVYCAYYVIMNIQPLLDLTHTKKHGVYAFMVFFGIAVLSLTIWNIGWMNLLYGIIMFLLTSIMYIPLVITINMVMRDD
ncbi:MAG: hypothetical protein J6T57_01595 [Alphaproteobacteria bacterium]|nr:hypothetical protein [Alphaproteobacteria bacterium]